MIYLPILSDIFQNPFRRFIISWFYCFKVLKNPCPTYYILTFSNVGFGHTSLVITLKIIFRKMSNTTLRFYENEIRGFINYILITIIERN